MPGRRTTRYRDRGQGALFQRCDRQRGCPPMETVTDPDGTTRRVRPEHRCRGMWIGQLDLGFVDGKRYRPTVSARTKQEASRKLEELRKQVKRAPGQKLPPRTLTVERWLRHWLDEVIEVRPKTRQGYRSIIDNWLIPGLGRIRLQRLAVEDVRGLYRWMEEREAKGSRPMAHRTGRKALADAVREGKIETNPFALVSTPSGAGGKRQGHTVESARKILTAAGDDRLESRWWMGLLTGKRQGECLGVTWDQLDLVAGVVDVQWQLQRLSFEHGCGGTCGRKRGGNCPARWLRVPDGFEHRVLEGGFALIRPKSAASEQPVPLVPSLVDAFARRQEQYEQERANYAVDHGLVHCRPDGRPIDQSADLAAWKALEQRADVPTLGLHAARHTLATHLLELGVAEHVSQEILGHTDAEVTRGYQHVDLTLARDALSQVERRLL